MRKRLLLAAILAGAALAPLPGQARTFVDVQIAPPAPRVEVVPAPRVGYVWAPGYWRWNGRRHVWIGGHWVRARRGFHWAPDAWVQGPHGRWHYRAGHWER